MLEHERFDEYMSFIAYCGLLVAETERIELIFGFKVWLKTVEQCEQILRRPEARTDVGAI